jgi:hypothetical protein
LWIEVRKIHYEWLINYLHIHSCEMVTQTDHNIKNRINKKNSEESLCLSQCRLLFLPPPAATFCRLHRLSLLSQLTARSPLPSLSSPLVTTASSGSSNQCHGAAALLLPRRAADLRRITDERVMERRPPPPRLLFQAFFLAAVSWSLGSAGSILFSFDSS